MSRWARLGEMILGLAIVLAPVGASAAGAPAAAAPKNGNGGPVLNYDQVTEMALKFSPDVQASRSEVKLAREQKNEVHGYRWVQL